MMQQERCAGIVEIIRPIYIPKRASPLPFLVAYQSFQVSLEIVSGTLSKISQATDFDIQSVLRDCRNKIHSVVQGSRIKHGVLAPRTPSLSFNLNNQNTS